MTQLCLLALALCQSFSTTNCSLVAAEEAATAAAAAVDASAKSSAEEACEKDESGIWHLSRSLDFR